ncbi:MAG: DUF4118 domain-containing protein [Limisphaerales bacterium]
MSAIPLWTDLAVPARGPKAGWKRAVFCHGLAAALIGVATVLRFPIAHRLGFESPFLLYYPAVVAAAWVGGLWPGLFATGLGAAAADYFWIPPQMAFAVNSLDGLRLALFMMASGSAAVLIERLHCALLGERGAREQLRLALASAGDAMVVTDAAGRIVFLNAKAQLLSGWSSGEVAGRAFASVLFILDEESGRPINNTIQRAVLDGRTRQLAKHVLLVSRSGRAHPVEHKSARIVDTHGITAGAVILFHDPD